MKNKTKPVKKVKKKKCRFLRGVRRLTVIPLFFHYGSLILKSGLFPFFDAAYEWIITHIYDGILGALIQPICQMLWEAPWYPQFYFWTGFPLLALYLLLTFLISMKEKSVNVDFTEGNWYNSLLSGGRYYPVRPSLRRRMGSWMQLRFFAEQNNLSEECEQATVLNVMWGKEEQMVDLGQLLEWEWKDAGVRLNFVPKEKCVRVSFQKDADVCLLRKGEHCRYEQVFVTYLE